MASSSSGAICLRRTSKAEQVCFELGMLGLLSLEKWTVIRLTGPESFNSDDPFFFVYLETDNIYVCKTLTTRSLSAASRVIIVRFRGPPDPYVERYHWLPCPYYKSTHIQRG
jgi:hypothetical protein